MEYYGKLKSGKEVNKITIENAFLKVSILTLGAIIESLIVKSKNRDIVVACDDISGWESAGSYLNEVIFPYGNRIKGANFEINGKTFNIDPNEGKNTLHSGCLNFGFKVFTVKEVKEDSVTLEMESEENEGGFPGKSKLEMTYSLNYNALELTYKYSTTEDSYIAPTNHVYFNLDGKNKEVFDYELELPSLSYVAVDSESIPTELTNTEGSDFDFNTFHKIGERREGFYDHCYVLKPNAVIKLQNEDLLLETTTDLPGVQLYTGKYMKNLSTKNGPVKAFSGVCLETEYYPNTPNRADFPSCLAKANKEYTTRTIYRIIEK